MGFLDFIKKKDVSATAGIAPPPPPGAMVSKFDSKLEPLQPLAPPSLPKAPFPGGLPPLPPKTSAVLPPPLPPRPSVAPPPPLVSAPKPAAPAPVLPPAPSKVPPPPVHSSTAPSLPPLPSIKAEAKPAPIEPPKPSLEMPKLFKNPEPVKLENSSVPKAENKFSMPQVVPPISGRSLPAEAQPAPVVRVQPAPIPVQQPSTIPSDEELRRVIAELQKTPVSFPVRRLEEIFVPVKTFDNTVITISEAANLLNQVNAVNEKLGGIETQTKTALEAFGRAFEGMHAELLSLDEKLFQVK